jgi:hypothetical protein
MEIIIKKLVRTSQKTRHVSIIKPNLSMFTELIAVHRICGSDSGGYKKFLDITPLSPLKVDGRFGSYNIHLQSRRIKTGISKIDLLPASCWLHA